jgi:adenylosuccinate lyase
MSSEIKNNFCEIIAAAESMWHERKGFDWATNKRSQGAHFTAIKRELERIKKNIHLLETEEFPMIEATLKQSK